MGDQTDDILNSFKLSTTQLKQYQTVKTKLTNIEHFVVRRNLIFALSYGTAILTISGVAPVSVLLIHL